MGRECSPWRHGCSVNSRAGGSIWDSCMGTSRTCNGHPMLLALLVLALFQALLFHLQHPRQDPGREAVGSYGSLLGCRHRPRCVQVVEVMMMGNVTLDAVLTSCKRVMGSLTRTEEKGVYTTSHLEVDQRLMQSIVCTRKIG